MARDDKSPTGAKSGVAAEPESVPGMPRDSRKSGRGGRTEGSTIPPSPMGKSTPGQRTSTRVVRAGESQREDLSVASAERDDRATRSSVARGSAATPVRATRGGDQVGGKDRAAGGRKVKRPRAGA